MKLFNDEVPWVPWVSLAARLVLGGVLIWSGGAKVGNLASSVQAANAYQIVPYEVAQVIGYGLPFAEIGLGLALVLGLFTRIGGALGALLMLAFIIAIASVWARGISVDCGCFGGGGPIDPAEATAKYPWELLRDTGLMILGLWLVFIKANKWAVDGWLLRPAEEMVARKDVPRAGTKGKKKR